MTWYYKSDDNQKRFDSSLLVEGDLLGPNKIKFIKRTSKKDKYHWFGIFVCPFHNKTKFFESRIDKIYRGETLSCGCLVGIKCADRNRKNYLDITGERKGTLTALYQIKTEDNKDSLWHVKCDCGNEFNITLREFRRNFYGKKDRIGNISCPQCSNKSNGEHIIFDILKTYNISFETEKTFDDCKDILNLRFDFYLPEYNCCIEYDGKQHFNPVDYFGGEESFLKSQKRDEIKNQYCKKNNIKLIRIPYTDINNINYNYIMERIVG
jgi:very-short-patch-repair endonuclease